MATLPCNLVIDLERLVPTITALVDMADVRYIPHTQFALWCGELFSDTHTQDPFSIDELLNHQGIDQLIEEELVMTGVFEHLSLKDKTLALRQTRLILGEGYDHIEALLRQVLPTLTPPLKWRVRHQTNMVLILHVQSLESPL